MLKVTVPDGGPSTIEARVSNGRDQTIGRDIPMVEQLMSVFDGPSTVIKLRPVNHRRPGPVMLTPPFRVTPVRTDSVAPLGTMTVEVADSVMLWSAQPEGLTTTAVSVTEPVVPCSVPAKVATPLPRNSELPDTTPRDARNNSPEPCSTIVPVQLPIEGND